MRPRFKPLSVYTLALLVLASILSLTGGSDLEPQDAGAITVLDSAVVPDLAGSWSGTWSDTRYGVGGTMTMVITLVGSNYSATGTIDVSQINPVLGTVGGTATGTLSGNVLNFNFSATDLGSGSGSFTDASATGTGTVTAPLNFGAFEFSGTVTGGQMTGTFNFTSPTGGNGVATLNKGVATDDATWSELKSSYQD